jgi:tRNA(Ile2) C34 agmatinyltransferase TiaS
MTVFAGNCCDYFVFFAKIDAKRAGTQIITARIMAVLNPAVTFSGERRCIALALLPATWEKTI